MAIRFNSPDKLGARLKLVWLVAAIMFAMPMHADDKSTSNNSKEARELFNKAYNLVFGKQGSSLSYSVNIIGVYKTAGSIVYKGKKVQYNESRYCAWEDDLTAYMVDKKKKKVDIYNASDDDKDEFLAKFKYELENFNFSYKTVGDYYEITAKARDSKFFGIREMTGKVYRKNLHPVSLQIKLAIFRCTVNITNFQSGNIDDSKFIFPRQQFASYTFVDHRKDKK